MIFASAASVSFCRDSISESVSRFVAREVAGFRLGERVETVAGGGAEFVFEVTMFLSGL